MAQPIRRARSTALAVGCGLTAGLVALGALGVAWHAASRRHRNSDLVAAVRRQRSDEVAALLAQGADPNARDEDQPPGGWLCHIQAAFGLAPQSRRTGLTALMWAAGNGDRTTLILLLDHGADPNVVGPHGATALMIGLSLGHPGVASPLLAHGAGTDHEDALGLTPLMVAARYAQCDAVRLLLAHGATVTHRGRFGMTALGAAGSDRAVRNLLEQAGARK